MAHAGNRGRVELHHHPRNPYPDDKAHHFPRLDISAKRDLDPGDYDDNQRKSGKHATAKGQHLTARRPRKAVKRGLNEGLKIPYFLRGEIGGDIRVNLNLHRLGLLAGSAVERRDSEKQPLAH